MMKHKKDARIFMIMSTSEKIIFGKSVTVWFVVKVILQEWEE